MSRDSVTTICFQTIDAAFRDEDAARLAFDMHAAHGRLKPNRVMLGSLEFPMVQYSIEREWNRLYFCEDLRPTVDCRTLRLVEQREGEPPVSAVVELPLHLNTLLSCKSKRGKVVFTTIEPHGLWGITGFSALEHDAPIWLLHESLGCLRLLTTELERVSEVSFAIDAKRVGYRASDASSKKKVRAIGFLHVPALPSPDALCRALDRLLRQLPLQGIYRMRFDAAAGRARLVAEGRRGAREDCKLRFRVEGDRLIALLALSSAQVELPSLCNQEPHRLPAEGAPPVVGPSELPSSVFGGLDYVELPEGWYVPSHRPMGTGAPLRFTSELEAKLNRLALMPSGKEEPLCLVLRDPVGRVHAAPLPHGFYTPPTLAKRLQESLHKVVVSEEAAGARFECTWDAERERFLFLCTDNADAPLRFDLLFTHPLSVDASRLGFERADCAGHSRYESVHTVHVPRFGKRYASNLYQASEVGATKRLSFSETSKPLLVGAIRTRKRSELLLQVRMGGAPFAHGVQQGDIVVLVPLSKPVRVLRDGKVEDLPPEPLSNATRRGPLLAVALDVPSATDLLLFAPGDEWTVDCVIGIELARVPFSLAPLTSLPRSLGGRRLGFPERIVQWAVDGSVAAGADLRVPPFVAPYVHSLDHPDYVLVYLEEGKQGSSLQHRHGGRVTTPFAKLVLYPLVREERMIPRETTLASGESLTRVTLRFENPDGTPYHFHGAEFSFTLNLVS